MWVFPSTGGGYFTVQNFWFAGKCADSNGSGDAYLGACDGGNAYQNWNFSAAGGGWQFLTDKATYRLMDSNEAGAAYTTGYNGGNYQQWLPESWDVK